jgi:hypothetical protein
VVAAITSSRKVMFSASTVMANRKPVGCASTKPNVPMMLCGFPMKSPSGMNSTNSMHSVFVGMSDFDVIRGLILIGAEVVKDAIGVFTGDYKNPDSLLEGALGYKNFEGAMIDCGVDFLASVAISGASGWERPIEAKIAVGGAGVGLSVEGKWRVGGPLGAIELVSGVPVASATSEGRPDWLKPVCRSRRPFTSRKPSGQRMIRCPLARTGRSCERFSELRDGLRAPRPCVGSRLRCRGHRREGVG